LGGFSVGGSALAAVGARRRRELVVVQHQRDDVARMLVLHPNGTFGERPAEIDVCERGDIGDLGREGTAHGDTER